MGRTYFSDQFRKQSNGYNLNVMQQSACLVINLITFCNFADVSNCTQVDRASDFMMAQN